MGETLSINTTHLLTSNFVCSREMEYKRKSIKKANFKVDISSKYLFFLGSCLEVCFLFFRSEGA